MVKQGLTSICLFVITFAAFTPWATSQQAAAVPAYNAGPPKKGVKLPPILGKEQLWAENAQYPYQAHAYELAAKIPVVLHQQPCYCYCDPMGQNSLHTGFKNTHGAECSTCLQALHECQSMHQKATNA